MTSILPIYTNDGKEISNITIDAAGEPVTIDLYTKNTSDVTANAVALILPEGVRLVDPTMFPQFIGPKDTVKFKIVVPGNKKASYQLSLKHKYTKIEAI